MTNAYKKRDEIPISTHFKTSDFKCHCDRQACDTTLIDENLVKALEELWEITGGFKINSGFRCGWHNKEISGKKDSYHLLGKAVDIESPKYDGAAMARYAKRVDAFENGGIGQAEKWIHVDVRHFKARWEYVA